ncbi:MAG: type II toxin-antitoxin system HicA family toxin [Synergistaceae bacterium]|nr:type II toxin-antitoxin system HicA family toxin [Synergistaceae bacterium]
MPRWSELKRYLDRNGWELYRTGDHYYYRKRLADGSYIRTYCSHGSGEIPGKLWKRILKSELHITQEDFNRGL